MDIRDKKDTQSTNVRGVSIGVFDSGLGGLLVFRSFVEELPAYDHVYLGDTKRVPYGNRSQEAIYEFLEEAIHYLCEHGCALIIVACNTASSVALRKIQQEYVPRHYPLVKVLGVIIPAAEAAMASKPMPLPAAQRIGVLATQATVESQTFVRELKKLNSRVEVFQQAAPLLVPLIEQNKREESLPFLREYLQPLLKDNIDTLILGCTHYSLLAEEIRSIVGSNIVIISQPEILPSKLKHYLSNHPEIETRLSKNHQRQLLVTDSNEYYETLARRWFGEHGQLEVVSLV